MGRTKQSAAKSSGKRQSAMDRGAEGKSKFQRMNFWAERGFNMQNAHVAFTATVKALGWEQFVQHRSSFCTAVVREFYEGIVPAKEGKILSYSVVRGVPVKFDSCTINECYALEYNGLAFSKRVSNFGKKEMEAAKDAISVRGTVWEKGTSNEFKIKRGDVGSVVADAD